MPIDLDNLSVTTTDGSPFTGDQHAQLAYLIWLRFGRNTDAAWLAWRRLLENNCTRDQFSSLVEAEREK